MVSVFDVSQTEGKELPDIAVDELTGDVDPVSYTHLDVYKRQPLTPDGNATLVDDFGGNKQLITCLLYTSLRAHDRDLPLLFGIAYPVRNND